MQYLRVVNKREIRIEEDKKKKKRRKKRRKKNQSFTH
jgi:hypothetical protein